MKHLLLHLVPFVALVIGPNIADAQSRKPFFPGAELLDTCTVALPLTYAKKDKERYTQAALFLESEELIYAVLDKKTKKLNCTRVFVVVEKSADGTEVVYLETADQHMVDGLKQAWFPKFRAASERFYSAECFDGKVAVRPELREHLVEGKAEVPK